MRKLNMSPAECAEDFYNEQWSWGYYLDAEPHKCVNGVKCLDLTEAEIEEFQNALNNNITGRKAKMEELRK